MIIQPHEKINLSWRVSNEVEGISYEVYVDGDKVASVSGKSVSVSLEEGWHKWKVMAMVKGTRIWSGESEFEIRYKKVEVHIDSYPSGAEVYISEIYRGTTPLEVYLEPGEYTLKLKKEGYRTLTEMLFIASSEEKVEKVLSVIQRFDPVGIGARNLQECLLIQAEHLGLSGSVVEKLIKEHFHLIEKKDPRVIAKALKCAEEEAWEALKIILGMEPKPGRPFADEKVQYIIPDIYIHKVGDEYVVVLNEDGLPKLRVSNYYRKLLMGKGKTSDLTRGYIQEKLRSAVWLIKSIHQRQRTIYKVAKSIVKFQREFFDKGVEYLKPLALKDVAQDIGMHESTVSRVTNNKYVHTPQGIYELKFFFNSSVNTTTGGEIAAETVKQKICQLIAEEDPRKPRSDQEITRLLREMGVDIARRTVTKYRESMSILSSTKRRKYI